MMPFSFNALFLTFSFALTLSYIDGFKFIKTPRSHLTVKRYGSVHLNWIYEIGAQDKVKKISIYNLVREDSKLEEAKATTNFTNKTVSLIIKSATYIYAGIYYAEAKIQGTEDVKSRNTTLVVEGKPDLGGKPTISTETLRENEIQNLTFAIRSFPKPSFLYNWKHQNPIEKAATRYPDSYYYFKVILKFGPLSRERCNKSFQFYARNRIGNSIKHTYIILVKFKPKKAQSVKAHYVGDGEGVKVTWDKQESGFCKLGYQVHFLNSAKQIVDSRFGYDIVSAYTLNSKSNKITDIRITVNSTDASASAVYKVTQESPPKGKGKRDNVIGIFVGSAVGIIFLIVLAIIAAISYHYKSRRVGCTKE